MEIFVCIGFWDCITLISFPVRTKSESKISLRVVIGEISIYRIQLVLNKKQILSKLVENSNFSVFHAWNTFVYLVTRTFNLKTPPVFTSEETEKCPYNHILPNLKMFASI